MRNRPHRRVSAELYRVVKYLAVEPYDVDAICEVTLISSQTLKRIMSTDSYLEYQNRFQKRSKQEHDVVSVVPRHVRLIMLIEALTIFILLTVIKNNLIK